MTLWGVPEHLLLERGLNQHFLIYASMDLGLSLPTDFNRAFLWSHLAAMVQFNCAAGLSITQAPALNELRCSGPSADPEGIVPFLERLHRAVEEHSSLASNTIDLAPLPDEEEDLDAPEVHEVTIDNTSRITRYGLSGRLVPVPSILSDANRKIGKVDDTFRVYWAIFDFLMCHIRSLCTYKILLQFRTNNLAGVLQINDTIRRARTPAAATSTSLPILILIRRLLTRWELKLQAVWVPYEECVKAGEERYMDGTEKVWDMYVYLRMRGDKKARGISARWVFGEAGNEGLLERLRRHEEFCEQDR